jgi:hypothetical protein
MTERLPGILAEIAAVAGEDAALAIAAARGGTLVYIPPHPARDHWLAELVGIKAARAIADRLTCGVGSMRVEVPLASKGAAARLRAKIDRMIEAGGSERAIAMATGCHIRTVRRRRAQLLNGGQIRDDRQLNLL